MINDHHGNLHATFFFLHSLNTPYLWTFLKSIFFFFVRHCLDTHGYLDFSSVPMKVKLKDKYHWAIVIFWNVKFDLDLVQLKYMLSTFRWRDHGMESSQLEILKTWKWSQIFFFKLMETPSFYSTLNQHCWRA